jgi:hypothetical protein
MKITRELLLQYSNNGAFTRKQLEALGLTWPVKKGWIYAVVGKTITEDQFKIFSKQNEQQSTQLDLWQ